MEPSYVHLNGALVPAAEACVSVFDHGLLYGDGLFETFRVYEGRFFRLAAHLSRLEQGAGQIGLPLPWPLEVLSEALLATVRANRVRNGSVRLTVTRGEGPPVPDPSACASPTLFIVARPSPPGHPLGGARPPGEAFRKGIAVCLAGIHPGHPLGAALPGLKSLCYLPFQLARQEARRRGGDEALLRRGESVVEASASNLFAVKAGELLTPDLGSGCLPGITRAVVLELARGEGIPCRETRLQRRSLESAEEIFLTNSLWEVMPVVELEGRPVGTGQPGPLTRRLRRLYQALVARELGL